MARVFTTNADHLDNAVPAVTALTTGLTLSAWVKINTLATLQEVVTLGAAVANANRWTIDMSATNFAQAQARDGAGTASFANSSATISAGVWTLITGTYTDDTNRAVLLNGGSKGTSAVSRVVAAPTNTRISANPAGNNPLLGGGFIAHIGIWNIVLSDSDILALYTNLPSSVQASNLQEYWPLTSGASPEPSSGLLGNSLTVTGTTFSTDDPFQVVQLMGQAIF